LDASLIFVPAPGTYAAVCEALDANIGLIIVITEGMPVADMVKVKAKEAIKAKKAILIGPNCPGILAPGQTKIGIIPGSICQAGSVGIVSRSGTLTYEAAHQIAEAGLGVSTVVGIGGDPVIGTDFVEILELFERDPQTQAVLLIGEIGGGAEQEAARHWSQHLGRRKPLFGFIAGKTAPPGRRMGHAGAVMEGGADSAQGKSEYLQAQGVTVIEDLTSIGKTLAAKMGTAKTLTLPSPQGRG
jgi:succinyl-CoA synthetase alpha subunit